MSKVLLAALLTASAAALAQSKPDAGVPTTDVKPAAPTGTPATAAPAGKDDPEQIRREVDTKVEAAKKEMREELRAQLATQSVAQGWQEEWVEEKRKLELITLDGYFRVRPDLFNKLDLNREVDPGGYTIFPRSPVSPRDRTITGVNMRLRLEPTINVSEEVRVRMQIDGLDNVVFGSNPAYGISQMHDPYSIFSSTQVPPSGTSLADSIALKRVYGDVTTPVGILRFGRMGSQWGLGMLHNDGNCLNCDYGDTVDRVQFVSNPFPGWYIAPMVDFDLTGPLAIHGSQGQPEPLSDTFNAHSYILAIARRDTDQEAKAKLLNNQYVLNYGIHFTYKTQKNDPLAFLSGATSPQDPNAPYSSETCNPNPTAQAPQGTCIPSNENPYTDFVPRNVTLYEPDVWAKFERKAFRIEVELAGIFGNIANRSLNPVLASNPQFDQGQVVSQLGGVLQAEYRLLDGKLKIEAELGFASGHNSPGIGNYPNRALPGNARDNFGNPVPGVIDGQPYMCNANGCSGLLNFQFNRDYRPDMILWNELLGSITGAAYVKPTVSYEILQGFKVFGSGMYTRALHAYSTPSAHRDPTTGAITGDDNLGVEVNVGARYETEDGFIIGLTWAILFPLAGLSDLGSNAPQTLDVGQALRGFIGIKF